MSEVRVQSYSDKLIQPEEYELYQLISKNLQKSKLEETVKLKIYSLIKDKDKLHESVIYFLVTLAENFSSFKPCLLRLIQKEKNFIKLKILGSAINDKNHFWYKIFHAERGGDSPSIYWGVLGQAYDEYKNLNRQLKHELTNSIWQKGFPKSPKLFDSHNLNHDFLDESESIAKVGFARGN